MAGVWLWLRRDWRARWRSSLAIAALLAITGGTVMALLAGARRTDASLDRFDRVSLDPLFADAGHTDPVPLRSLAHHPQVEAMGEVAFMAAFPEDDSYFPLLASVDGGAGKDLARGLLLRGRRPDPDEPLEVVMAETNARRLHAEVGSRLRFRSLTPEQWAAADESGDFPEIFAGPKVDLRVVGVVRTGFDLSQRSEDPLPTLLTPAFFETYGRRMGVTRGLFLLRLKGGFDAAPRFGRVLEDAYRGKDRPIFEPGNIVEGPRGSNRVVSTGLVLVAAVAAVAGLGWLALTLHRHVTGATADLEVLAALGLGRAAQFALLLGSGVPGLLVGTVGALAAAVAASPLLPVGLARRADPDVGLHADLLVLASGVVALAILGAGFAALGVRRARRTTLAGRPARDPARGPGLGARAGVRLGPVATTGLAFALQPGRGARATPVRPALAGAVAGLIGVVGVGVVGASMGRLVDTPARYGAPWDVAVSAQDLDRAAIVANRDVDAAAVGLFQRPVTVKGSSVSAYGLDPVKGGLGPALARGRAPSAPDEVALGADTLGAAHLGVGGRVAIATAEKAAMEFRVVGQAVFPSPEDPFPVADGALLTPAGLDRLGLRTSRSAEEYGFQKLLIRWRPGVDHKAALARLGGIAEEPSLPQPGAEVARLAEVEHFPQILAGFLVAVSLIAVAHGLAATVRKRGHDLAVLGALGFTPGQRRGVVAWQAVVLAGVGVVLGLPLGIVAGRSAWAAMAGDLGVATDAAVPAAVIAAAAAGAVVLFALLAVWSGRSAARLRPAEILRTE